MGACVDQTTWLRMQDGEVAPEERARVATHLSECAACRERLRSLMITERTLSELVASSEAPGACVDEMALASFAEGRLPEPERLEVTAHVASCHTCSASLAALGRELLPIDSEPALVPEWALERARSFVHGAEVEPATSGRELAGASSGVGATGVTGFVGRWLGAFRAQPGFGLAGAAAALLVLVLVSPAGDGFRVADNVRGTIDTPVLEINSPRAGAVVTASPDLQWSGLTAATRYTVTVVDDSGNFFWQLTTADAALRVPASAGLMRGQGYSWWVVALLDDGTRIESARGEFRVRP